MAVHLLALTYILLNSLVHVHYSLNPMYGVDDGPKFYSEQQLQLTTVVSKQEYCSDTSLRLILHLNFKNVGKQPLILYKNSSVIIKYMLSENLNKAMTRKYKLDVSPTYNLLQLGLHSEAPDESAFVVLNPGQLHTLKKDLYLQVSNGKAINQDLLNLGSYYLQIKVLTWYYSPYLKEKIRRQWLQKGYLWTESVISQPMAVTIEKGRIISKCLQT